MELSWWRAAVGTQGAATSRLALELARELNVDVSSALREYGIDEKVLTGLSSRVPIAFVLQLLDLLSAEHEFVGLRLGSAPNSWSPVIIAARNSDTLGEALAGLWKYRRLGADPLLADIKREGDRIVVTFRFPVESIDNAPVRVLRQAVDWYLATLVSTCRNADAMWKPLGVRFSYSAPSRTAPLERYFGCPLIFGNTHSGLDIACQDLELPISGASKPIKENLEDYLDILQVALSEPSDFVPRVGMILLSELRTGATMERTAQRLGISPRTLQRRLREKNASFRTIRADVRRKASSHLLVSTNHSIETIAAALGYASSRSFDRAFFKWYGYTPSEHRHRKPREDR